MAGTTATLALPFPNATDPDDVPADVQRLAERVDAVAVSRLGGSTIIPSAAGVNGLVVRGVSGQTADLQTWQLSDGFAYARVLSDGSISTARQFAAGGNPLSAVRAAMHTGGASVVGLVVRSVANQTANLQEWQNDAGAVLARIATDGGLLTAGAVKAGSVTADYVSMMQSTIPAAGIRGLVIRAAASQTANLQEWQNDAGAVLAAVKGPFGYLAVGGGGDNLASMVGITSNATGSKGLTVRAIANQSAALQEWQSSTGAVLAQITPAGALNIRPDKGVDNTAIVSITTSVAGDKGIVVRGVSGQTGSLQEWQSSGAGLMVAVTSTGRLILNQANNLGQSGAVITARGATNALEFGHTNNNGYGSVLGTENGSGTPNLIFFGENGTSNNTYTSRGLASSILRPNGNGGFTLASLPTNTTNGTPLHYATMDGTGLTINPGAADANAGRVTFGADSTMRRVYMTGAPDFFASLNIQAGIYGGTGAKGIVVRGAAGQTGLLQEWRNSGDGTGLAVGPAMQLMFGRTATPPTDTNFGQLFVDGSGALYYRAPSGAITLVGNA